MYTADESEKYPATALLLLQTYTLQIVAKAIVVNRKSTFKDKKTL
ncbi:hypothetical protein MNBD_GAMMA20-1265 [hydrothermal vent metagenome]|uniref:Uncharacterized protein n=1 Tax=hydrothermal vent metagenome TaxID=652676 RepID=A0A3B1AB06_9ZZZZ